MSDWKAPMPRELPEPGKAHIVVAVKFDNGGRVEFCGQVPEDVARRAFLDAVPVESAVALKKLARQP